MPHDLFLSHSSKDKTAADAICATLEREGIRCWVAPRDILPGGNWGESIIAAIESSRIMLVVFSAASNRSPQVMREVERAVSKGLPIIPLRIEDVIPSKSLEFFLSVPHWLDAISPPLESHLVRLANTVKLVLNGTGDPAMPSTSAFELPRSGPEPGAQRATPPKPVTASELRRIAAIREQADDAWNSLASLEDKTGLVSLLEAGQTMHGEMLAAFEANEYPRADARATDLLRVCYRIKEATANRTLALGHREKAHAARRAADGLQAQRLAPKAFDNAERFLRQADQCYQAGEFEIALDHWLAAEKELESATRDARSARAEEIKAFVVELAVLLRDADPRDPETRQAASRMARERHLSGDQARLLVGSAKNLAAHPGAVPVPFELLQQVMGSGEGLGPSLGQRLILQHGARGLWPLVVFLLWFLGLLVLPTLMILGTEGSDRLISLTFALVLFLITGGLLLVPIRIATRRPVGKRPLWITLIAGSAVLTILTTLVTLSLPEAVLSTLDDFPYQGVIVTVLPLVAWPLWTLLFWRATRELEHFLAAERVYSWVIKGSILDLLVAVPSHILARRREECSAGAVSGLAIFTGVLFAFLACGPGLLLLYVQRIGRLRVPPQLAARRKRTWTPLWIALAIEGVVGGFLAFFLAYGIGESPRRTAILALCAVVFIALAILTFALTSGESERKLRRRSVPRSMEEDDTSEAAPGGEAMDAAEMEPDGPLEEPSEGQRPE